MANSNNKFWRTIGIIYIPIFLVALALNGWLMYYSMFLKNNLALTTNFINEATYQDEDKYQIEVNYFSNEKGNGEKVIEIKFNYYVDVSIPEKDEETGEYDEKLLCSSSVQLYAGDDKIGLSMANIPTANAALAAKLTAQSSQKSNFILKSDRKGWGSVTSLKMNNGYFYEQAANAEANKAMKNLDQMDKFIWDINGQLCLISTKGEKRTGTGFLWIAQWTKFDTTYLCKKIVDVADSLSDGEHIQLLNFSDFYHVRLYNEKTGKFEEEYNTNEEWTYVNVYFKKSSNGMVEAQQSMFDKFCGNSEWTYSNAGGSSTQLYWTDASVYEISEDDFAYSNTNSGLEIYLKNSCKTYLEQLDGFVLRININLDNISSQVVGLKQGGLYDFNIYQFNISSSTPRTFKIYKDYDITTTNVTVLKGGVA